MENNDVKLLKEICTSLKYLDDETGDLKSLRGLSAAAYSALTKASYLLGKFDPISLEEGAHHSEFKKYEQEYISWCKSTAEGIQEKSKIVSTPVHDTSGCRDCLHRNDMCAKAKKFPCLLHTKELSLTEMWELKKKEMGI
jgi:hypothetical protein